MCCVSVCCHLCSGTPGIRMCHNLLLNYRLYEKMDVFVRFSTPFFKVVQHPLLKCHLILFRLPVPILSINTRKHAPTHRNVTPPSKHWHWHYGVHPSHSIPSPPCPSTCLTSPTIFCSCSDHSQPQSEK